jgi:hypothetical protein
MTTFTLLRSANEIASRISRSALACTKNGRRPSTTGTSASRFQSVVRWSAGAAA